VTALLCATAGADILPKADRIDSPEWIALRANSTSKALGTRELRTYTRRPGIGNDSLVKKILSVLPDMGLSDADIATGSAHSDSGRYLAQGNKWMVHVSGGGQHGRAWLSTASLPSADISARISYDNVVALAQKVLDVKLRMVVGIASEEKLPVQFVSYMGQTAWNAFGVTDSRVVMNFVTFGRFIDGVPVTGSGSFVKIGLDVSGRLAGFDFDWSQFDPGPDSQTTVPVDAMSSRFAKLGGSLMSQGAAVKYTECGYYDPGVQGPSAPNLLQPACVYSIKTKGNFFPIAVPAGATFRVDSAWPETAALSSQ